MAVELSISVIRLSSSFASPSESESGGAFFGDFGDLLPPPRGARAAAVGETVRPVLALPIEPNELRLALGSRCSDLLPREALRDARRGA